MDDSAAAAGALFSLPTNVSISAHSTFCPDRPDQWARQTTDN